MEFIRERQHVEEKNYRLFFPLADDPHAGYMFECDEHGTVDESKLQPAGAENYRLVQTGEVRGVKYAAPRIETYTNAYWMPAVGKCNHCGAHVELDDPMTNECSCGALYNSSGQRLKPIDDWFGEDGLTPDTGESRADLFGPQNYDNHY